MSVLKNGKYQDSRASSYFPDWAIVDLISQFVQHAQAEGRSQTLKAFHQNIRELKQQF